MNAALVLAIVVASAGLARADADAEFAAIGAKLAHGELTRPAAIEAYEQLAQQPPTRWTDDAWEEAARLAEQTGDYARARRDLVAAIAASNDPRLIAHARAGLARIAAASGEAGEWDAIAAEHDRLVKQLDDRGDPHATLAALEALARANPAYPRGLALRLSLARAWEADGEIDRAIGWLAPLHDEHARVALAYLQLRHGRDATATIAAVADPVTRALLGDELAAVARHRTIHAALWIALAAILAIAAIAARRIAGSWRGVVRVLARPPGEVMFVAPIAIVLAIVAATGNPLVARAVGTIAACGVAIAWCSGALGAAARHARLPIALVGAIAAASVAYLALDHGSLATMIAETWRAGPQR